MGFEDWFSSMLLRELDAPHRLQVATRRTAPHRLQAVCRQVARAVPCILVDHAQRRARESLSLASGPS